jgi:hypothetical protein
MANRNQPQSVTGEPSMALMEEIDNQLRTLFEDTHNISLDTLLGVASAGKMIAATPTTWALIAPSSTIVSTTTTLGQFPRWDGAQTVFGQVLEADIPDGTILARVASVETISARWLFSTSPVVANGVNGWKARNGGDTADVPLIALNSTGITIGAGNSADTTTLDLSVATSITMSIAASVIVTVNSSTFRIANGLCLTNQDGTNLSSGPNHNIGQAARNGYLLTGNADGTSSVTGITAVGVGGNTIYVGNAGTVNFSLLNDHADSTSSNRMLLKATTVVIPPKCGVWLTWTAGPQRWVQVSDVSTTFTLTAAAVSALGYWAPLTDPATPEVIFDSNGDVVMAWVPTP